MLQVTGVTVRFDAVTALDGVDLTAGGDETVAVLGASGSGKTTLLRVVAGLLTPDAGTVSWEGTDLAAVPAHLRRFGVVFQDFALFPHLDVGGNVGFGLRMSGVSGTDLAARVAAALDRVGLGGLERRHVDELSGGQAQRVALARTLATEPRLLLLDEPLGSLDPALRRDLAADLGAALATAQIPALLVTHDTAEAFALADRIAVMDHGRIVRTGTPEEVWRDPGTVTVAELLGHTVVTRDFAGIAVPAGRALALLPGAIRLDASGPIVGTVLASAFRGPEWVVTVEIDGVRMAVESTTPLAADAEVRLSADRAAIVEVEAN